MNDPGHVHTFVIDDGPSRRTGDRRHHGAGRSLWKCIGCPREVWTDREDGPVLGTRPWGLHAREMEVLLHVTDGRKPPYIAYHMGVSVRTVQNYQHKLRRKLGVRNDAQMRAAYQGYEAGLYA